MPGDVHLSSGYGRIACSLVLLKGRETDVRQILFHSPMDPDLTRAVVCSSTSKVMGGER